MRAWVVLALVGLLSACGSVDETPVAIADSVRAEFEAICARLGEGDQEYYGRGPLERLAARLDAAEGTAAITARRDLGIELLEHGRSGEAIDQLSEALQLARDQGADRGLRVSVLYRLALAHLRAAEDTNCVQHHTAESCIFPISAGGIHGRPEHARQAGDLLQELVQQMKDIPLKAQVAWLLNLARMLSGDYPAGVPAELALAVGSPAAPETATAWPDRAMDLGINVVDLAGGAVMDDFDGDGLLDLVTSTSDPCGSLKAFRNDGRGGFENVTATWGLDGQLGGLNLVHADYDNDGRLDLLVLRGAWLRDDGRIRNSLLRNELGQAGGRFVDVTHGAGLAEPAQPTQTAAWADYDNDGDLDLYVGNESRAQWESEAGDYPSQLFRNDGDGTFTDVAAEAGVANDGYAKGVAWGDYDNDGDPDLYVSNVGPNRMYRNDGGRFTDVATELGLTHERARSFADWFFDYDNDGDLDLFVVDYQSQPALIYLPYFGQEVPVGQPLLYRNDDGRFTDVSRELGLTRPLLPMGCNYGDLDNDGWLDLYLGTGNPDYSSVMPNIMYRNESGRRFADVTFAGRFGHLQKGHGVAFGDVDNDGDQDLFHQLGGFYPGDAFANALFENPGSPADWVTLRLEGRRSNRFGLGARIELRVRDEQGGTRSIHRVAGSGGSFGGSSFQQEIGLGRARTIEEIVVRWPGSGTVQRFRDLDPGRIYRLIEDRPDALPVSLPEIGLAGSAR